MILNFCGRKNSFETYLDKQAALGSYKYGDPCISVDEIDCGEPIEERLINCDKDFLLFIANGKSSSQNGANVVFTGKQYVFSVNLRDGKIRHPSSIAKTISELKGDHSILGSRDASKIYNDYKDNYLRLRISAENHGSGEIHYSMKLYHKKDVAISPEEYSSFEAFVEKFKMVISRYPFTCSIYSYSNDEGLAKSAVVHGVEGFLPYLQSKVKDDKKPYVHPSGEVIIGTENEYDKNTFLAKKKNWGEKAVSN